MADLAIVLVNYGQATDTIECVQSLRSSTWKHAGIIVVDNGSPHGAADHLEQECPEISLIRNPFNAGFAEACNIGIREAFRRGADHILLLNNDTTVRPDAVAALVAALQAHPEVGMVGPKILYHHDPSLVWFAGGRFNQRTASARHIGMGQPDSQALSLPGPSEFLSGCCMLLRRDVLETVGLLDASYFAYCEDADLCTRARRNRYTLWYEPSAVIYHKVSNTSSWDSPVYIYLNLRNKLLFLHRNSTLLHTLPYVPALVYFYTRQFVRLALKHGDMRSLRAAWYGMVDGLLNRTGVMGEGRLALLPQKGRRSRR